jgi:hypothetical protein
VKVILIHKFRHIFDVESDVGILCIIFEMSGSNCSELNRIVKFFCGVLSYNFIGILTVIPTSKPYMDSVPSDNNERYSNYTRNIEEECLIIRQKCI